MPRQKGIIKLKGSMGGITFYGNSRNPLARETGGVDRDRILKDPEFKRTRENMAEFGGSATIGKALRTALSVVIKAFGGQFLVGRIVKLMKEINARGPGLRGKRAFEIVVNKDILEGFEFNDKDTLGSVFNAPRTVSANADRNEVTVTVPDFNTDSYILAPEGATHFRLVTAIASLSDYVLNSATKKYEPTDPNENGLSGIAVSSEIPLSGMVGSVTTLVAQLPGAPVLPVTVGLIATVGIDFLQELNGDFYLLASGNAMKIESVF